MPTAPGVTVNVTTASIPNTPPTSYGTFFAIGQAESGPVGVAVPLQSLAQYVAAFGSRTFNGATQTLYDAIDTFFQEGGSLAYVSRVSGADGATAALTLDDRAGTPLPTLVVSALGPGSYGNVLTVAIANGSVENTFVITVTGGPNGTEVSPNLYTPADAVNWAQMYSATVSISNSGSATSAPNNNPAVLAATVLAGGVDDTNPADSLWVTALTAFDSELGMGQVAAPGRLTQTVWQGLIVHAQGHNRFALLDGENIATGSTIISDAGSVQEAVPDGSWGVMLAAWPIYSGPPSGTPTPPYNRTVAPSGPLAGVMAALAGAGNNADVVAAGNNGILSHAIGVSQTYTKTERGLLEAAGVTVIRDLYGNIQAYGATSLSASSAWADVGNCRLRMQIVGGVQIIGLGYVFADIDGGGHTASAFGGQISSFLTLLYNQNALYGATPADAFTVNVGPSVNTAVTAQARELLAQVAVRMSPTAEQVIIDVTAYPPTAALPA